MRINTNFKNYLREQVGGGDAGGDAGGSDPVVKKWNDVYGDGFLDHTFSDVDDTDDTGDEGETEEEEPVLTLAGDSDQVQVPDGYKPWDFGIPYMYSPAAKELQPIITIDEDGNIVITPSKYWFPVHGTKGPWETVPDGDETEEDTP